jgi:hypothetical protein
LRTSLALPRRLPIPKSGLGKIAHHSSHSLNEVASVYRHSGQWENSAGRTLTSHLPIGAQQSEMH